MQHLSHIGFNAVSKKWDIENIPADWKAVFKAAGIRKRDLENEVAAHELMQTISEFTMKFQTDRRILPTPPNVPPPPPKIRKSIQVPSSIVQSSKAKDSEERYSNFQDPGTEKVSRSGPSIQDQIKQGVVLRQSNQITSLSLNADDQKSIGEALKCKMSIIRSRIAHLGPDTDDDNDDDW